MSDDQIIIDDEDGGEIVHWYEAPEMTVSTGQAAAAVAGAFVLGALTAVGVLALIGRIRD